MATVDRWLLPDGIEEVLPPEAARIETARRRVLDLFQCWGYELVITPHVEFLESLLTGAGQDLDLKTFKVIDPLSGRQMGLRADITPQVARVDAHTLRREGPSRLCYAGSVLHAKPQALASMLRALARLCGGRETLDAARSSLAGAPAAVLESLDDLVRIADQLAVRYPDLPLYFDLGELRGYHYHTGVVFAGFVPGVGQSIAQGGRYDDIGADFGRARPATGFSTDLKTLVSLGNAELVAPRVGIWAPHSTDPALWQAICRLRAQGDRVVQALDGQRDDAALSAGCDRQLLMQDGSWVVTSLPR